MNLNQIVVIRLETFVARQHMTIQQVCMYITAHNNIIKCCTVDFSSLGTFNSVKNLRLCLGKVYNKPHQGL